MKIKKFHAEGIHGYLTLDTQFYDQLTFLTGINGSGKTTAVNAIVALISPNFSILGNVQFKEMWVEVEHENSLIRISAQRYDDRIIRLSTSSDDSHFVFGTFSPDPDELDFRNREREAEYYREVFLKGAESAVLKRIADLPIPMFLDLDRRARSTIPDRARIVARPARRSRNVFSVSLTQSLAEATALAEQRFNEIQVSLRKFAEESRRQLILGLLTPESAGPTAFLPIQPPKPDDIKKLAVVRKDSTKLPQLLQVPTAEIEERLLPFLDQMETHFRNVDKTKTINELMNGTDRKSLAAAVGWTSGLQQLNKISSMMQTVSIYDQKSSETSRSIKNYLDMVNRFLADSGKTIYFDELGSLVFKHSLIKSPQSVSALSSGEAQIFVILTHLSFNPLAQTAGVFIVDEPELSLHVEWQEIFVESVLRANPNLQYIMATHAPSIILNKIKNCRSLSLSN